MDENLIEVSIIVPTYNRAEMLLATVGVILKLESNRKIEVVVIDSGQDQTEQFFRQLYAEDSRLSYHKLAPGKNRSLLRNVGAERARGDVLIFIDGDILIPPGYVDFHCRFHE